MTALPADVTADLSQENARLQAELRAALARQTATSEILRVISQSPTDVKPVFDAIVLASVRLLGCDRAFFLRCDGATYSREAIATPEGLLAERGSDRAPVDPEANFPSRAMVDKKTLHLPDWSLIDLPEHERFIHQSHGVNTSLYLPLLREGECIYLLVLGGKRAGMFGESEIALAESFRDQALIAIENTRLFNETREALERQTATADILKVIASSPSDVQPVFDAIAELPNRLIGGHATSVLRFIEDRVELVAFTSVSPEADAVLKAAFPIPLKDYPILELVRGGEVAHVFDTETETRIPQSVKDLTKARGLRSFSLAPLMGEKGPIGVISVSRREPGIFAPHHVQLLQTFADQAVIAIQNVRLFNETREALERQTATADILKVIASSPSDVQPVFEAIATNANRLIGGFSTAVMRYDGGAIHLAAFTPTDKAGDEALRASFPRPRDDALHLQALRKGGVVQIPDTEADTQPWRREMARKRGFRSQLFVPLMNDGETIGHISVTRVETGSFADHHIQLLRTFADQAVIAIENVRLFNETREALERQTATADILRVIASSPDDVKPVFEAIAERSNRLIEGLSTAVYSIVDDTQHLMAFTRSNPEADAALEASFPRPLSAATWGGRIRNGEIVQVPDFEATVEWAEQPALRKMAQLRGFRGLLFVPLLRDGKTIGLIGVTRKEPGTFAAHHIQLLQTFADQAVIAIGNVRLFDEVQAKTRDLTEALTYQTGSSNILKVIASSPTDVGPVLKAIVESSCELCGAYDAVLRLSDGNFLRLGAHHGPIPVNTELWAINRNWTAGRAVLDQSPVHVHDLLSAEGIEFPEARALLQGHRTVLSVPLMREGESIGAITLRRLEVNPFSDKQIALLQTFADQAVIAIGNVQLFEEVQARTRDLTESLQQQTATSEVLEVISSSPGELEPVFNSMLKNAVSICDAQFGNLFLIDSDGARWEAGVGTPPALAEYFTQSRSFRPTPGSHLDRVMRTRQVSHTADDAAEAVVGAAARLGGARSTVCVPMVKDETLVGAIFIYRTEVRPFTDKQIDLVKNFAAQAVIAIENTRLLRELRQRTDDLTASLDDLRTAQDRLVQTEKLASLGQLTAGIAHEIKNPLNFVNNFAALSAELTDELNGVLKPAMLTGKIRAEVDELTGLLKDNLEKVVQHGKRADSIVKNMLLHSREGSGEHRPADINALLDESLNLAYHGARAERPQFNVTLQRDFDDKAGMIELFPQEITRVFLNLIANGFYAVTKRKTENGSSGFEPVVSATTRDLGSTVEIRIRDNGTGIPAEVREKMFNPFFTTKPAGEGTGLGLSMSHDIIVKQHGGSIDVETQPGQFTEFRIILPRTGNSSSKVRGQT